MATKSQRPKTRDEALSSLNAAIDTLNLAGEFSAFAPAKAIFASVGVLLGVIKVHFTLFCGGDFPAHIRLVLDGQREVLC